MKTFRRDLWHRVPRIIRQTLVGTLGILIIILGIILIPLPGPGWAIVFAGLAVLATEFPVAKRAKNWIVEKLRPYIDWLVAKVKDAIKRNQSKNKHKHL